MNTRVVGVVSNGGGEELTGKRLQAWHCLPMAGLGNRAALHVDQTP